MFINLKQTTEKRRKPNTAFGHRFVLTLLLLIVGAGASWGQTTYVFKNGDYYMRNPNPGNTGTPQGSTTFDANCVWVASGTLGSTSRTIYSKPAASNNNKYLSYSVSGNAPSDLTINATSKGWKIDSNGYLYADTKKTHYVVGTISLSFGGEGVTTNAFKAYSVSTSPKSILGLKDIQYEPYITAIGNYQISATGFTQVVGTIYSFNGESHTLYDVENGEQTTVGVTVSYSLGTNDYASVNSSTGAITVNSLPTSGQVAIPLTITASKSGYDSFSLTYNIYLLAPGETVFTDPCGYAITLGNAHFLGGSSTNDQTSFNPKNSIWTLSDDNKLRNNADYYLIGNVNASTLGMSQVAGTATAWSKTDDSGHNGNTTGYQFYVSKVDGTDCYVNYNTRWKFDATIGNSSIGYNITKYKYLPIDQDPEISGDNMIAVLGENSSFRRTKNAIHQEAYHDYVFYSGASHLFDANDVAISSKPIAEYTYTWSLSGNAAGYASIDAATGVITYENYVSSNTNVTVTLTATAASPYGSFTKTASQTVTLVKPSEPSQITVESTDIEVMAGGTAELHYTLSPTIVYNNVYATPADGKITADESVWSGNTGYFVVHGITEGMTSVTLTARKIDGTDGPSIVVNVLVKDQCAAPEISFADDGTNAMTTLSCETEGATIYYTTDGSMPSPSHGTVYSEPFEVVNNTTVKAMAVCDGYFDSNVTTSTFSHSSGVFDDIVVLYDTENHGWTVYQPQINGETNKFLLPEPKDVKITYRGNGGEVSKDEPQNTFVYYKTLTKEDGNYHYTLIPNPFSKRPKNGDDYQGFYKWKITRISGGAISGHSVNDQIDAETELTFVPASEYGMEVDLEAVWTKAYVVTCTADGLVDVMNSSELQGDSYETNFIVVTAGYANPSDLENLPSLEPEVSKPVTITMVMPDGSVDYRSETCYLSPAKNITLSNDWKFEYINMNNNTTRNEGYVGPTQQIDDMVVHLDTQTTVNVGSHYLILGRGISNTNPNELSLDYIRGLNEDVMDFDAKMRIESGFFRRLSFVRGCTYYYYDGQSIEDGRSIEKINIAGTMHVNAVLGCDYDRATENNNLLKIRDELCMGSVITSSTSDINLDNASRETLNVTVKSGNLHPSTPETQIGGMRESLYASIGIQGSQLPVGRRVVHIEGGQLLGFAGGIDSPNPADKESLFVRMTGGELRGSMYGAAAFAETSGDRRMIITGGAIRGWLAGGCNGTSMTTQGGVLPSDTYIYVGGNATIGNREGTTAPHINFSDGGNVFGAGSGNTAFPTTGQVNNSHVAIADDGFVQHNVFGGGNFGYTSETAHVYIAGGTVCDTVFGGSNQKLGQNVEIMMNGGLVKGGIYGGSNITGTVSGYATLNLVGGQVGTVEKPVDIHGGGMGAPTQVDGNIDITLGDNNGNYPTIFGDVYGGGALGLVNGTSATPANHTKITVNNAQISGNVFGGGLGYVDADNHENDIAANVFGTVTVDFKGGSAKNIFGCNNINGAPQCSPVTVNVTGGTVSESVYGGGLAADYEGNVSVQVNGAGTVINGNVYGGGLNGSVVGTTTVVIGTPSGDAVKVNNVFGAGKGETSDVNGQTYVTVESGTVKGSVYGGAELGTINKGSSNYNGQAATVRLNGGTVKNNVYGGGKLGVSVGQTIVNVDGARIENNVFGGAQGGVGCEILVAGLKTVNVSKGTIIGDIYGGSENAVDANLLINEEHEGLEGDNGLYALLDALADDVKGKSTIFVNMYGGRVYQNVYGGGFFGKVYGSTTVNIGKNAIENAPDHEFNVNKPSSISIVAPVHISGSVYAGSDWGTFVFGQDFGDPNISGYSNIYVDGDGYDMQEELKDKYMIIYGAIYGCGTSSDAGQQGHRVFVRNYGLPIFKDGDHDQLTGCTRSLLSIQRADDVYLENSHITFLGQGNISSPVTTQKFAMNNITKELRVTGPSTINMDFPIDNLVKLSSMKLASGKTLYTAAESDYSEVTREVLTGGYENLLCINNGSYINVKYPASWAGDTGHNYLFGELQGFFYVCSSTKSLFAFSRPKDADDSECPETYSNDADGGFVSYLGEKNTFTETGEDVPTGNAWQIPFTNQVPDSKDDQPYFRFWQFKDANDNYREVVITAKSNGAGEKEYLTSDVTIDLPAATGSYYKISSIDWGLDVAGVDAALVSGKWTYYSKDENVLYHSIADTTSGTGANIPAQLRYIDARPNIIFGIAVAADGCLMGGVQHANGGETETYPALILSNNTQAQYVSDCRFDVNPENLVQTPKLKFLLTYSNQLNKNDILSPIHIVLDEYDENGIKIGRTDIDLIINTMTDISQSFKVPGYAVMTGDGENGTVYTAKVTMPTFGLVGGNIESKFMIKNVTYDLSLNGEEITDIRPADWFDDPTHTGTAKDVALMFGPSMTFDNIQGWLTGFTPEDPESSLVDVRDIATACNNGNVFPLGTVDGRTKFGFDVKLIYDGRVNISPENNYLGTVTFTIELTNHELDGENQPVNTTFDLVFQIYEKGRPKGWYVDGENGNNFYEGGYPNQSTTSVNGIFNSELYAPIDNIFIVNTVTINDDRGTEWNGAVYGNSPIIYRYPGGHQEVDLTTNEPITYPDDPLHPGYVPTIPACDDALIVANNDFTLSNIIIDGMSEYDETYDPDLNNDYYHTQGATGDHGLSTEATSPLIEVNGGAEVTLNGSTIRNNYNSNGGTSGILVNDDAILNLGGNTSVTGNHNGAGITMNGSLNVSGKVVVDGNYGEDGHQSNVVIADQADVVNIGDGGLDPESHIGVTKAIPDGENYTPIAYSENADDIMAAFENGCFFDDMGMYAIIYDPNNPNLDPNTIYFGATWVTYVTDKPEGFDAENIDSKEELAWVISIVNGFNGCTDDNSDPNHKHNPDLEVNITEDLDMTEHIWVPIGSETSKYIGNFDGGGNEIKINCESLYGLGATGLFGYVDNGAEISNVYAYGEVSSPDCDYMGSIAGVVSNGAQVHDCIGSLKLTTSKTYTIMGALVGLLDNASLTSCITQADMNGYLMGGLVGQNYNDASVKNCYANPKFNYQGTVAQPDSDEHYIAGLVADQQGTVENSYIYVEATDIDIPSDKTFYVFTDHVDGGSVSNCYYSWNMDGAYPLYNGTDPTTDCDKYFEATIPYKYNENFNRIGNETTGAYLLKTLNDNAGSTMTNWFRIASPVNQDLPLLRLPESATVAEIDGLLHYNASLQETMGLYDNNYTAISVYASSEVETTSSNTGEDYKIYIGENAAVLQGAGCTLKAFVGITLDNSAGEGGVDPSAGGEDAIDWHMFSTSLSDAPLGINYIDGSGNPDYGVHDWWHDHFQGNYPFFEDNDLAGNSGYFPDDTPRSDQASLGGYDFYCYYEPHFHWINFKRNGNSHWHEDAIDDVHEWIPYSYTIGGTTHTASTESGSTFTNEPKLIHGKGYLASVNDETYLQAYGTLNNGSVVYEDVFHTNGVKCPGLNLLGNPYQSYLDFDKFALQNDISSYTILDEEKGGYVSYTVGSSANDLTADKFIHMHQGFFVVVDATQTVTFTNAMRNATTDEASFRGDERPAYPVINLILNETSGNKSYAVVELDRPGVGGAKKVSTLRSGDAQIYVHYDNEDYSLVFTQPGISSLPVRFDTDREGTFTLNWNTLNATFGYLHLIDNKTGADVDCLSTDKYVFTATPDDFESRFKLVFQYTGIEENGEVSTNSANFAFFNGDELIVNGEGRFEFIDLQGRRLYVTDVYGAQNSVSLPNVASGLYLLRLTDGKQSKTQKIVVNNR